MKVNKNSYHEVSRALEETVRNLDSESRTRVFEGLSPDDWASVKMRKARYWHLRKKYLEQRAAAVGVVYSRDGSPMHVPV